MTRTTSSTVLNTPKVVDTAAANDLIREAIGDLLSNKTDPRHATALVQLVNCSQRINQHADLEARLEKLEQASNGTAASLSGKDPESAGAPAKEQGRLHIPWHTRKRPLRRLKASEHTKPAEVLKSRDRRGRPRPGTAGVKP
jgi:hypothetical protein